VADKERFPVDLDSYIFELIEYDPTEDPRGIVTAEEWNTILNLLKSSTNYTSKSLQEIVQDLYTATELSSTTPGESGAALIGVEPIAGLTSTLALEGNVSEALKEIVQQMQNIALGEIPAGSLTAEKFAPNLNFTGDKLTFNDFQILTQNDIVQELDENSSDKKVLSALASYNFLNEKQDNILVGTSAPNEDTKGNIYIQLDNDIKEYYTKEEADELLKAKQPNLTAGANITITNNVISAANVTKIPAADSVFQVTYTGPLTTGKEGNGHGKVVDKTHTFYLAGYLPIGIVGSYSRAINEYGGHNTVMGPGVLDMYLTNRNVGSCTLFAKTYAANNDQWTYHVDYGAYILWVKVN
jgi:hypothetical protein